MDYFYDESMEIYNEPEIDPAYLAELDRLAATNTPPEDGEYW